MRDAEVRAALIEQVRQRAAEEGGRLVEEAMRRLEHSPEQWSRVEGRIRQGMHDLGRSILEVAVKVLGNGYQGSRRVCACGGTLKYMSDRERDVVSLMGLFRLKRAYYWCAACGASDAPLDRRLGMERSDFSPSVRQMIGRVGAEVPFCRGRLLMGELAGLWVSQRQHQQISERIGAGLMPDASGKPVSALRQEAPERIEDLYLSADGTTAHTFEGWREVKIGAVFLARPAPDGLPQRAATRYFGDVIEAEAFGWRWYHLASAMGLDRARRVIVLGDGAAWIWNLVQTHFPGAIEIVDWYHAAERVWTVAHACFGEATPEAARWAKAGEKLLRQSRVETLLVRLSRLRPRHAKARQILRDAQGYFRNNAHRMRYRHFRRQGLFIGSGVVEAGCKHIVGFRLKQSGMRWSLDGLRSILHLRLALLNGDWPTASSVAA